MQVHGKPSNSHPTPKELRGALTRLSSAKVTLKGENILYEKHLILLHEASITMVFDMFPRDATHITIGGNDLITRILVILMSTIPGRYSGYRKTDIPGAKKHAVYLG